MLAARRASPPGSAGQLGLGWQPEPSCKVCRLAMPPTRWTPCPHPRVKSASLPPSPMCSSGVFHLCLPLLKGGRGSWHTWCCSSARMSGESSSLQEHNAGRPCESRGRCSVGSSLLPHILLLVAHVRCLNKTGDSGTAFESLTTK